MGGGFESRLARTYGIQISLALVLVTVVFGFAAYVLQIQALSGRCAEALRAIEPRGAPTHALNAADATALLGGIMSHTYYRGLEVGLLSGSSRYEGRWGEPPWPTSGASYTWRELARRIADPTPPLSGQATGVPYTIHVEPRSAGPVLIRTRPIERIVGSMALLAGFSPARAAFGDAELTVDPTTVTLFEITVRTLLVVILVSVISVVLAHGLAHGMALQALRPLALLLESLEARAAGDLLSRPLPIEREDELGRVIAAYNEATQMTARAFAERDAAEAQTHRFIADAGHQLRTPLTVLRGFVGILRKGQLRHPDDAPKLLEKAERQIALMGALIERLTLLENWHAGEPPAGALADISALVADVVGAIAAANPEREVRITTDPAAFAKVDVEELTYAITNLVANALKYGYDGAVDVAVHAGETSVTIAVVDHGKGIAPEELPHIFDRFYRGARRDVPGSGLGLSIAKLAVERARGTLSAENEAGAGARFTITLPREHSKATRANGTQPSQPFDA
ncbi:MAG TPA: HAMP domain-containing sensor histidine kinase [Candidatus Limnocylindria bacterium]|nr:HAMP domain-containing sensor histidine kinase [Candidatus Limnocylindria bacterium]